MITPSYCQAMARYNMWQNTQIATALAGQPREILVQDRAAFFGSILGTLSHLLWGDLLWMSRFDPRVESPGRTIATSVDLASDFEIWHTRRVEADGFISSWADRLDAGTLEGDLTWFSGAANREVCRPVAFCVTHMFNHQTHHRGQVHALMTEAGLSAPVSDLFLMPEAA